jgi:VWFA-related protein
LDPASVRGIRLQPDSAVLLASWLAIAAVVSAQQSPEQTLPRPQFSTAVEVTTIDVTVVDGGSRPITDLAPEDFSVRIDGAPRKVLTAQWMPLTQPAAAAIEPPPGYSTNLGRGTGRLIVIAIDQPNIRFGGAATIQRAVEAFIDGLQPSDRVAAVGIGPGGQSTPFTADRERVKRAVRQMAGNRTALEGRSYTLSLSEALDIYHGITAAWQKAGSRECAGLDPNARTQCMSAVQSTATALALQLLADGSQTLAGLESLFDGLRAIPGQKTMVLVSEGFVTDDPVAALEDLGTKAALAQTSVYALKLDDQAFDLARGEPSPERQADRQVLAERLEVVTGAARGSLFDVFGSAAPVLDRIESELSGYYLLGVESHAADRDGSAHRVQVTVGRNGLVVRSRRAFVMNAAEAPRPARVRAAEALGSPLLATALPLRVATFSLGAADASKVQVLLHAEIGELYPSGRAVSVAYMLTDRDGRVVDQQVLSPRLSPLLDGVPSPLQFSATATVPPGEYVLKFAAAEADQVGSVEHPVRVALGEVDRWRVSDLITGGPPGPGIKLQPTVGHSVNFGILHAYLEAYGPGVGTLVARYEIAAGDQEPALATTRAQGQLVNEERALFTHMMAVRQLPPGRYVLRVYLLHAVDADAPDAARAAIATRTRPFEVAPPPVLLTSAETGTRTGAPADVFLPVDERLFERPFTRDDLTRPQVLSVFRDRVAPEGRGVFDRGVEALRASRFEDAQAAFKSLIQIDGDNTGPLTYLGGTYAWLGFHEQAAGAWQTALISGSDRPEIFAWLGDALLRARDLTGAQAILEEATRKWPGDTRFAKPLALIYATFGQGREAVRTLERHLDATPNDAEALALGVEWIYQLQLAGAVARTRAEDVRLARRYADAYARLKGPQAALVREWADAIERTTRR